MVKKKEGRDMFQVAQPIQHEEELTAGSEYVKEVKKFVNSLLVPRSEESKQRGEQASLLLKRARLKK